MKDTRSSVSRRIRVQDPARCHSGSHEVEMKEVTRPAIPRLNIIEPGINKKNPNVGLVGGSKGDFKEREERR